MSERKWTPEQAQAISADAGTVLVTAAAGSGKTSVLTERIIRKLTDSANPVSPDELLVVTFTNAAAAEMRARVYRGISAEMRRFPEKRQFYSNILTRLDEAQICTMDAFCMGLVKENAHECGIEPDYRILDKGEATAMKNRVMSELLEKLYAEDSENFLPLSRMFEKGRDDTNLSAGILKLSEFSMSEPEPEIWLASIAENYNEEDDGAVWKKVITDYISDGLEYAEELICGALKNSEINEELHMKFDSVLKSGYYTVTQLRDDFKDADWNEKIHLLKRARDMLKGERMPTPKGYGDNPVKINVKAKRDRVIKLIESFSALMCADEEENRGDIAVLKPLAKELIYATELFNNEFLREKIRQNAYEFSDISHFALKLLVKFTDGKPEPTALSRSLSERFSEILIDEYQDTNRAQDALFSAVSRNSENMFMVGDVKQSVYRFRLASPELFIEKSESFPHYDGVSKKSKIVLGRNFRSREGVVDAVNFVFNALLSKKCGEVEYNEDERLIYSAGYPESSSPDTEFIIAESEGESSTEYEAEIAAGLICEKIAGGLTVFENGTERPAVYGDFCIILRSAKNSVDTYVKVLERHGIATRTEAKTGLLKSTEIMMLMSLLRVVDNPKRDVDMLSVMLSPVFGFSVDDAARVKLRAREKRAGNSLYSALKLCAGEGDEKCINLCTKLSRFRRLAAVLPADALIREIFDDTAFISLAGAMSGSEQRINNIRLFTEYAQKISSDSSQGISGFVRYIDALEANGADIGSAGVNTSGGALTIMTVHKSKGLEFPFVILGGITKHFNATESRSELLISHKNGIGLVMREPENIKAYQTLSSAAVKLELKAASVAEELRIYYVAMTRAREKLFIVAAVNKVQEKIMETEALISDREKISPFAVQSALTPFDWFIMAYLHHPDAGRLRCVTRFAIPDSGRTLLRYQEDIPLALTKNDAADENLALPDERIVSEIKDRASYVYKYAGLSSALSKRTSSDLQSEKFNSEFFASAVPAFAGDNTLSPADIGTATHRFLQFCDFGKCAYDIESERARLAQSGRLSAAESAAVDFDTLRAFFASPLMKRVYNASSVMREKQFTVARSVRDFDDSIDKAFAAEQTVVVGKIDMIFIEDGKAVIVDYKTDRVKNISALKEKYSDQLGMYASAAEEILGMKVSDRIIYSLYLKEQINV